MAQQHFPHLGPLDFIFTEYNHDFKEDGATTEINLVKPKTYLALFDNYDADSCIYNPQTHDEQTIINPHLTNDIRKKTNYCANDKWYNDNGIVKAVFCGRDKFALCTLATNATAPLVLIDINVCVKEKYDHNAAVQIYGPGNVPPLPPGVAAANFRHYITTMRPAKYQYYTAAQIQKSSNLIYEQIFTNHLGALQDIYIVSDAAGSFVRDICDDENFANAQHLRRVHCMYSTSTFGDPSNLQHPNDEFNIYRPIDENCKKYSWICVTPLTKSATDAGTLIHAEIEHSWPNVPMSAAQGGPVVTPAVALAMRTAALDSVSATGGVLNHDYNIALQVQKNILPAAPNTLKVAKNYPNSRVETSKPAAKVFFSEGPNISNTKNKYLRKLWRAQGKRLGDHEQILFAKLLQDPVLYRQKVWQLVEGILGGHQGNGVIGDDFNPPNDPLPNSNSDNTFLTTGDWPCFCYAIYNRINCILVVHKNWHVVKFN